VPDLVALGAGAEGRKEEEMKTFNPSRKCEFWTWGRRGESGRTEKVFSFGLCHGIAQYYGGNDDSGPLCLVEREDGSLDTVPPERVRFIESFSEATK